MLMTDLKEIQESIKAMEDAMENIEHNRMLERNWQKLKRILQVSLHKDLERQGKERECPPSDSEE